MLKKIINSSDFDSFIRMKLNEFKLFKIFEECKDRLKEILCICSITFNQTKIKMISLFDEFLMLTLLSPVFHLFRTEFLTNEK